MLGNRGIGWSLTAVIFGMIIFSELEAVVAAALQVSLAASVAVMLASIARSVTVSLSFITGLLGSTTSPPVVVPSCTSLTRSWLGRDTADILIEGQQETQPDTQVNQTVHLTQQFSINLLSSLETSWTKYSNQRETSHHLY